MTGTINPLLRWFQSLRIKENVRFDGWTALLCLPALGSILAYGTLSGNSAAASIVGGGALAVGFGSVHAFNGWRPAAMVLAALGMSLSAFVGSTAGNDEIGFIAICALWATACAIFASIEFGAWWIVLQWSIALFVAGYYPSDPVDALERAGLVLAGGLFQIACVTAGWRVFGVARQNVAHHSLRRIRKSLQLVRQGKMPTVRHAARTAISVGLAAGIVHWLALPNGYWAPMTAMLVLKPKLRATRTRGLERISGTVAGAGLASLISLLAPSGIVLLTLTMAAAWTAYALQRSQYILFTMAITATIVLVLALNHAPEISTAWNRLLATLLGGGLALCIAFLTNPATYRASHRHL
jgi:uncharacterized membrane protein YccC